MFGIDNNGTLITIPFKNEFRSGSLHFDISDDEIFSLAFLKKLETILSGYFLFISSFITKKNLKVSYVFDLIYDERFIVVPFTNETNIVILLVVYLFGI